MSNIKTLKNYPLVGIKTDQISSEPGRFCMSYGFENSALQQSISQVGIINNPYIYRNEGRIEIITGFRRILALKESGAKEIMCFEITDSDMTPYEMLRFALYDNLFAREFNLVEKSMIINRLTGLVKDDDSINKLISLLNINQREYDLVLKIEAMDESIKKSVSAGLLNMKTLECLINMTANDQLICNSWIIKLKLNFNQQIQFIDYISDISRIYQTPIQILLNDKYYLDLLDDEKKNIPQKAKELIDTLRERRNPDFSGYQNLFEKRVRKLQLPKNIKIKHPRYFESEFYQLEIEFKDGNELRKALKNLAEKDDLDAISDPWLRE